MITAVNGDAVDGPRELARKIASMGPDKKVDLTVWRDGTQKTFNLTLGTLPADKEVRNEVPTQNDRAQLSSLGLSLAPAASVAGAGTTGVVVADVDPDGIAAQKGLKSGDVILEAAGKTVSRPSDISAALDAAKKDGHKAVLLRVKSGDSVRYVALAAASAG